MRSGIPHMLMGAALALWGWQTGLWFWAAFMALALMLSRRFGRRWDLGESDISKISDLCMVMVLGALVYFMVAERLSSTIYLFVPWLPVLLFPLVAAQHYGTAGKIDIRQVSLIMRRQKRRAPDSKPVWADLNPAYILICLLAAAYGNSRSPAFYPCAVLLIGWLIACFRPPGRGLIVFGLVLTAGVGGGYAGHAGIHWLQHTLETAFIDWWAYMWNMEADPYQTRTAIGDIMDLKPSNYVRFRVRSPQSESLPILLREASYDHYVPSQWRVSEAALRPVSPGDGEQVYRLGPESPSYRSLSVYLPTGRGGTGMLKLPVGAFSIHASALIPEIRQNGFGAVVMSKGPGLLVYDVRFAGPTVMDRPPGPEDLLVHPDEAPAIAEFSTSLGLAALPKNRIPPVLEDHFNRHFTYSLDLNPKHDPTPLSHFLRESRSGHCEYYATAAVLIMRSLGIPARYAVGYSVHEPALLGDWVLVRSRHAHAWALAFLDGRWMNVDATPAGWQALEDGDAPLWQGVTDLFDYLKFQYLRFKWLDITEEKSRWVLWLIVPLVVIVGRRVFIGRKKRRRPAASASPEAPKDQQGRDSPLLRIEGWLASKALIRPPGDTLMAWTRRLESHKILNLDLAALRDEPLPDRPLQERLADFTHVILWICLVISAVLFVLGMVQGNQSWAVLLLTAVSLAVAAIPEGLPAITTITLALGMQRMARRGAIIRHLPAVETLGSATVICSDKTGTLTQNQMTVQALWTDVTTYRVSGEGYGRDGTIEAATATAPTEALDRMLVTGALCNQASLHDGEVLGDPTEVALLVLSDKGGVDRAALAERWQRVGERPFDSDRQRMAVLVEANGERRSHVKGAPESVLPLCTGLVGAGGERPMDEAAVARVHAWCEERAGEGLRVLALADRPCRVDDCDPETDLVFLGCVAMQDPPRPEVPPAVETCRKAGIKVVMITGDHKLTAVSIAKKIGVWDDDALAFNGRELEAMAEDDLEKVIDRVAVFARMSPQQKLRVVQCHMRRGQVVAMTGDGINDAPGLRTCHIGVAMGRSGTDVAREASDMILMDDNFATIVHAIFEGRTIFANIRKFIYFLLSVNAGLVAAVLTSSFFDWMPMLTPLQLLWINLVTNGMPALALGVDPPLAGVMEEPPRRSDEPILGRRDYINIALQGTLMAVAALSLYFMPYRWPALFGSSPLIEARGLVFTVLAFTALFHSFNCRSTTASFLRGIFDNGYLWLAVGLSGCIHLVTILVPALNPIFKVHGLTASQWGLVLGLAALPLPLAEVIKAVWRRGHP